MSRQSRLQQLLGHPRVWRYGEGVQGRRTTLPTGFSELDERIGGGWPLGVLTELLYDEAGGGELRMLMPALARLSQHGLVHASAVNSSEPNPAELNISPAGCWVAWVAPPYMPYPPALAQHGIDVSHLLFVRPDNSKETLWTIEQALRSGACGAVLGWLAKTDTQSLRRLQLAAAQGACWAVICRNTRFAADASPAPLRIQIKAGHAGPNVELLRNRYGRAESFTLVC